MRTIDLRKWTSRWSARVMFWCTMLWMLVVSQLGIVACQRAMPEMVIDEPAHDFGKVAEGDRVEHTFVIENDGDADLFFVEIEADDGLVIESDQRIVRAGEKGGIRVAFDAAGYKDRVDFDMRLETNDAAQNEVFLSLSGYVIDRMELGDRTRVYYFAVRQPGLQKSVILSHPGRTLVDVDTDVSFLKPRLEPWPNSEESSLLIVDIADDVPPGTSRGLLKLMSTDEKEALIVPFQISLDDVVSVRPAELHFSELVRESLDEVFLRRHFQVSRQLRGGEFEVTGASTTLEFIRAEVEPTEDPDRFDVFVTLDQESAPDDPFTGELIITTSEPDFSEIHIPISGSLR